MQFSQERIYPRREYDIYFNLLGTQEETEWK